MHTYIAGRSFPFDLYVLSWQLDRWNKTGQMVKKGQLNSSQTFIEDLSSPSLLSYSLKHLLASVLNEIILQSSFARPAPDLSTVCTTNLIEPQRIGPGQTAIYVIRTHLVTRTRRS